MEKVELTFENYIRKVNLSAKRREVYYVRSDKDGQIVSEKGKPLPNKFKEPGGVIKLQYNLKEFKRGKRKIEILVDENDKPVLANPKIAGTPKDLAINGQDFYSGNVAKHTRAKVMREIKLSFTKIVNNKREKLKQFFDALKERKGKFTMEILLLDEEGLGNWDLRNRIYPYEKGILDLLVTGRISSTEQLVDPVLEDDSVKYNDCVITRFKPLFTRPNEIPFDDDEEKESEYYTVPMIRVVFYQSKF
jgi:hypothetical protein